MDDQLAKNLNEQSLNVIEQQGTTNSKVLKTCWVEGQWGTTLLKNTLLQLADFFYLKLRAPAQQHKNAKTREAFKHQKYLLVDQQVRVHVLLPDHHHHRAQVLHLTSFALQLGL